MTVRWTTAASKDYAAAHAYIAEGNLRAANAVMDRILEGIAALERHPEMGRKGRVSGTRELVVAPYVVAYRMRQGVIEILAIIHGARKWPDWF